MKPLAYLVSAYPAVSHTFIFNEIKNLRARGLTVHGVSVNAPRNLSVMNREEQEEAAKVFVLKRATPLLLLRSLTLAFLRSPLGLGRMLLFAASLLRRGPRSLLKATAYFLEAVLMIPWLQARGVEHIHEHFGNPTALVAMLLKRYGGFSYSLSIHGPDIFETVDSALLREKVREATFVRCISYFSRGQLYKLMDDPMRERVHIVRCGVDPISSSPLPRRNHGQPLRMLCVGRLCHAKGQEILLEACALLRQKGLNFQLVMVGDGERREALEALRRKLKLEAEVIFTGAMGRKEVQGFYREADLFVLPSFAEGLPVVLMEAMAHGLPVVSTRIHGIPELIEDGVNGLLVPPTHVAQLAEALSRLIQEPGLAMRLSREACKTISTSYDQKRNTHQLGELFPRYGVV